MASSTVGFSPHRSVLSLGTDRMDFVVDTLEPRHIFLQVLLSCQFSFYQYTIFAVVSVW